MDPVTAKKVVFTTREKGEGGDFAAAGLSPAVVINPSPEPPTPPHNPVPHRVLPVYCHVLRHIRQVY